MGEKRGGAVRVALLVGKNIDNVQISLFHYTCGEVGEGFKVSRSRIGKRLRIHIADTRWSSDELVLSWDSFTIEIVKNGRCKLSHCRRHRPSHGNRPALGRAKPGWAGCEGVQQPLNVVPIGHEEGNRMFVGSDCCWCGGARLGNGRMGLKLAGHSKRRESSEVVGEVRSVNESTGSG